MVRSAPHSRTVSRATSFEDPDSMPGVEQDVVRVGRDTAWGRWRWFLLHHVVTRRWFDRIVLAVIAANSVCLALDEPLADQESARQRALAVLDQVGGWACGSSGVARLPKVGGIPSVGRGGLWLRHQAQRVRHAEPHCAHPLRAYVHQPSQRVYFTCPWIVG